MKYVLSSLAIYLLFIFPVNGQNMDKLYIETALIKLKNAREYTLQVADLMPGNLYGYKPVPEEMSFAEQLLHLASNLSWLSSSYLSKGINPVSKEDAKLQQKKDVRMVLEKAYDYAINVMSSFNLAQLSDTVSFFAGPMTKFQIITLLNDHQTHHRAQMLVYLRLNSIKPPRYVGW